MSIEYKHRSVVIEQCACFTPLGTLDESVDALLAGKCAIMEGPTYGTNVPSAPFANIMYRDFSTCFKALTKKLDYDSIDPKRTVLIYCAAKGDISGIENAILNNSSSITTPLLDMQAEHIAEIIGIVPAEILCVSNACASGAVGIEIAKELLETEEYEYAIVCGFDVVSRFAITGFYALNALSDKSLRPFDSNRSGLNLGDGAAIAILSNRTVITGDCIIAGAGTSNDANHRTGPSRTGDGLATAAFEALKDASISPESIGAVKCHGTATPYNDAMEAKALSIVFKNDCPPCVSLKGAIGHLSGAGSLVELLIIADCLKKKTLPSTVGYKKHGVQERIGISPSPQKINTNSILCLSAGFGGLNAAIVIKEII